MLSLKVFKFGNLTSKSALFFLAFVSWPAHAQVFLNPGSIVTSLDYPAEAVARGDHGITTFRLDVKQDGSVGNCEIIASTATPELDGIVCRLMLQRAKFDLSVAPLAQESDKFVISKASAGEQTVIYTNRVRWTPPVRQFPRFLFDNVTLRNQTVSKSNEQINRCEFSDDVILFVEVPLCFFEDETRLAKSGKPYPRTILKEYLEDLQKNPNSENSYNIAALLLDNSYLKQSLYYLELASKFENSMASFALCNFFSEKSLANYVEFNPSKAIDYCILSYGQNYNPNVVTKSQSILNAYRDQIDPIVAERARNTIIYKAIDAYPLLLTPGNKIISPDDYPTRENRANIGGVTMASLLISKEGNVASCLVNVSTYNYWLDRRACVRMKASAVYRPASVNGRIEAYWVNQSVRWNPAGPARLDPASIFIRLLLGIAGAAI